MTIGPLLPENLDEYRRLERQLQELKDKAQARAHRIEEVERARAELSQEDWFAFMKEMNEQVAQSVNEEFRVIRAMQSLLTIPGG